MEETAPVTAAAASNKTQEASDSQILQKMQKLEEELDAKEQSVKTMLAKGQLEVNGPLPMDFSEQFARGVAEATGCAQDTVTVLGAAPLKQAEGNIDEVVFQAQTDIVSAIRRQAADPDSKLANGRLHSFLVVKDADGAEGQEDAAVTPDVDREGGADEEGADGAAPEVDAAMPYGDLEPFGREDTAQELTQSSIRESDAMVDQLERAEVAEEKRAVFRALTRLRGAAISAYDGIARAQSGNLDEYSRSNHWRENHPVQHLANEESDVSRWAFPSGGDF